jgi:hypothetical protein
MASFLDDLLAQQNTTPNNPDYSKTGMSTYDPLFQLRTPTPAILEPMLAETQEDIDYQKEAAAEPKLFGKEATGNVPAVDMDKVMAAAQIDAKPQPDAGPSPMPLGMAASLPVRSGDDLSEVEDNETPEERSSAQESGPQSVLDRYMAVKSAQPQTGLSQSDIQAAIDKSNQLGGLMMLGKGAERIGAALNRQKADPNFLNEMAPLINKPVEIPLDTEES